MPRFVVWPLLLLLAGCQGPDANLVTLVAFDQQAEALAGARAALVLVSDQGGLSRCPEACGRLERVGTNLVQRLALKDGPRWRFALLCSEKPNAFSLPVRRVYLTRGLYRRIGSDDTLLAAAIAHEMAHLEHDDCTKPPAACRREALRRETAADALAVEYLKRAGYPADSMARLLALVRDLQPADWYDARLIAARDVR